MKPKKFFPFLLAVGLFLLVLGLLLMFRYAQARGSMMVLAFVFVGAGCTVLGNLGLPPGRGPLLEKHLPPSP